MLVLADISLKIENQHPIPVYYNGKIVREYFADILVKRNVILEIKAIKQLNP